MKKFITSMLALILLLLCGCSAPGNDTEAFTVKLVCESEDIYQIFYSSYFNGEYFGMGGFADIDGEELTPESEYMITFTKAYLEDREDVSGFSMTFSPYGKDDRSEIATTEMVYINAEYGESYTVIFSGDRENGFTAVLG